MRERPIIFSAPMVEALLAGTKTMTRRIVKPQPEIDGPNPQWRDENLSLWRRRDQFERDCCPYGSVGDRLWVREMLRRPDGDPWVYAADNQAVMVDKADETAMLVWAHHKQQDYCPSIHMPRWASRITLEITGVRVERLQEISEADAFAEGAVVEMARNDFGVWVKSIDGKLYPNAVVAFQNAVWSTIHAADGPKGWAANPFAWVIEFTRCVL